MEGPGRLVVIQGDRLGRKIMLEEEVVVIGRALECAIRFDVPQLSRRHAEIRRLGPLEYELVDLASSNGTFLNGVPVKGSARLRLGDKLRFGTELIMQLTLHDPIEEQLLQRQRLETLGRLGAGIAHDFNNMLGAVVSNLEYLASLPDQTTLGEGDTRDCLNDINSAAQRAAELSQRLVAFARGESQADAVIDVAAVCTEVAQLVRRTFGRAIVVTTHIDKDLWVTGESLELHQVLMNLCLNARDAMPAGGSLTIHATRDASNRAIAVTVADTGMGMDDATKSRMFEPFFSTKKGTGFGLGLATVRDIVGLLNGQLTVTSSPNAGASFTILLPERVKPRPRSVTSAVRSDANLTSQAPLSILVVDDEEMVRRSIRRVLEQAGHAVSEATSGADAIRCYKHAQKPPDVVILDIDMPGMAGEDTLDELLELDADAAVLMVSGHRDNNRNGQLRLLGARGFLQKPWCSMDLLKALDQAASEPSSLADEPPPTVSS